MAGLTLDSGALIAFERNDRRLVTFLKEAITAGADLVVPTVVVAETWRGGTHSARIAWLLSACLLEPIDEPLARAAGEALGRISGAGAIDAIVMAVAARQTRAVLTSDVQDLERLSTCFPDVRVLAVVA